MRVLVVSSRPPWPPVRADQNDVDRLIRFLSKRGHDVDLLTLVESAAAARRLRQGLGEVCREIETVTVPRWRSYLSTLLSLPGGRPMQVAYFHSNDLRRRVEARVASGACDLVYVHLIRVAESARGVPVPKILAAQVSQALNIGRIVQHAQDPIRRAFFAVELRKVRPYEVDVSADFDSVLLGGSADIEEMRKTGPVPQAVLAPHGQDIPDLDRIRSAPRVQGAIVMCGVMATYTNVDAATWFARRVFPLIEREIPEAQFWIVGRHPQRAVRALARPGRVAVTGEVPDVYDWLARASLGVVPIRMAAGQQNKLLQAMASELPVIATSVGNEGIGATPGEEICIADEPEAFAHAAVALLRDNAERSRMGKAARRFVEARWTWEQHFLRMEAVFQEVAGRAAGRAVERRG